MLVLAMLSCPLVSYTVSSLRTSLGQKSLYLKMTQCSKDVLTVMGGFLLVSVLLEETKMKREVT